jgi:hypothetical protein
MNTAVAWGESKLRSDRVKAAVQRNAETGRRTGGGSRPFGYKIIYHDLGEGSKRQRRIIREELEPAEADAVREAVSRVLSGAAPARGEDGRELRRQGVTYVGHPDPGCRGVTDHEQPQKPPAACSRPERSPRGSGSVSMRFRTRRACRTSGDNANAARRLLATPIREGIQRPSPEPAAPMTEMWPSLEGAETRYIAAIRPYRS